MAKVINVDVTNRVLKPVGEVFQAIVDPDKLAKYIELAPFDDGSTKIHIVESAFPMNEEGVQRALEQTEGWTDFINCMRAYLEFGVQLRKGRTKDLH